ncbi:MAG: hypothetical protein P1V97_02695 [Planctomycetota bacterium]|nr:hypothetical protein [Planctomycetota bacterium]
MKIKSLSDTGGFMGKEDVDSLANVYANIWKEFLGPLGKTYGERAEKLGWHRSEVSNKSKGYKGVPPKAERLLLAILAAHEITGEEPKVSDLLERGLALQKQLEGPVNQDTGGSIIFQEKQRPPVCRRGGMGCGSRIKKKAPGLWQCYCTAWTLEEDEAGEQLHVGRMRGLLTVSPVLSKVLLNPKILIETIQRLKESGVLAGEELALFTELEILGKAGDLDEIRLFAPRLRERGVRAQSLLIDASL